MDGDCRNATTGPTRVTGPTRAKEHVRLVELASLRLFCISLQRGGGSGGGSGGAREREREKKGVFAIVATRFFFGVHNS